VPGLTDFHFSYKNGADLQQPMTDFYTPFIVDDLFDHSAFVGDHLGDQFQGGLVAKPGPFLSMSAYEKVARRDMLGMWLKLLRPASY
jgi:hypothetical protein